MADDHDISDSLAFDHSIIQNNADDEVIDPITSLACSGSEYLTAGKPDSETTVHRAENCEVLVVDTQETENMADFPLPPSTSANGPDLCSKEISTLKFEELRTELKKRNLKKSGNKSVLIERLQLANTKEMNLGKPHSSTELRGGSRLVPLVSGN